MHRFVRHLRKQSAYPCCCIFIAFTVTVTMFAFGPSQKLPLYNMQPVTRCAAMILCFFFFFVFHEDFILLTLKHKLCKNSLRFSSTAALFIIEVQLRFLFFSKLASIEHHSVLFCCMFQYQLQPEGSYLSLCGYVYRKWGIPQATLTVFHIYRFTDTIYLYG